MCDYTFKIITPSSEGHHYKIVGVGRYNTNIAIYNLDGELLVIRPIIAYINPVIDYRFGSLQEAINFASRKVDPCPTTGEIIGYKKAYLFREMGYPIDLFKARPDYINTHCLITLRIPAEARRTGCYYEKKCRAEFAEVVKIEKIIETRGELVDVDSSCYGVSAYNKYNKYLKYEVGKTVYADSFDENKEVACSGGIHFFLTKEEALAY